MIVKRLGRLGLYALDYRLCITNLKLATTMTQVRHLFISPGHNYFGHHGRPADTYSTIEVDSIECMAGRGIRGDRFFDYKPDYKGQITFFDYGVLEQLAAEFGVDVERVRGATRRNVLTSGLELAGLIGKEFEIQRVLFAGVEECRPCLWMDQAFGKPGVETWLRGRGGLRARILSSGTLRREAAP